MYRNRARGVSSKFQIGAALAMAVVGVTAFLQKANAASVQLQDTNLTLTDPGAWVGGVAPQATDTAVFGSTLTGAVNSTYTWTVGAGTSNTWLGIQVLSPGGNIVVNDSVNSLTLSSGGIDMSAATKNLTLNTALNLITNQTWNVAAGESLILGQAVSLAMNGASTVSVQALTITGAGNTTVTGSISGGTINQFTMSGSGILTMTSANTYSGATVINSGTLLLDFNAAGASAPTSNIISANSQLRIGSALVVKGNAGFATTQAFNGTVFLAGLTTIDTTQVGAGLTVNFGALSTTANDSGSLVRIVANSTLATLLASGSLITGGNAQGDIITYGLYDNATAVGGVIGAVGSPGFGGYFAQTVSGNTVLAANGNGSIGTYVDMQYLASGTLTNTANNGTYDSIRFNTNATVAAVQVANIGAATQQIGMVLVTPNVGPINITLGGSYRPRSANNTGGQFNFFQNDTQGTLTVTAALAGNGTGRSVAKAGAGLVIFSGAKGYNGNLYIYEGELRTDDVRGLGDTNGTTINLLGGTVGVSTSMTNSNGTSQHPIIVGLTGGGINVTGSATFTISGSSNTAISGAGLLTKSGTGSLILANTASSWSGGFVINGGFVGVSALSGTPVGKGAVSVNAGGSLSVTGVMNTGFSVASGGTWVPNVGTINGAITLSSGAVVTGTGSSFTPVVLPSGVSLNPGTSIGLSTIGLESLALNSGSILNLTLQAVPKNSDNINILSGGSLSLGASGIVVNMFAATSGIPFFSNGSYVLFTGVDVIDAGKYTGGATSGILTNFVTGNLDTSGGAAAAFSLVNAGTASNIIVTITGGFDGGQLDRSGGCRQLAGQRELGHGVARQCGWRYCVTRRQCRSNFGQSQRRCETGNIGRRQRDQ